MRIPVSTRIGLVAGLIMTGLSYLIFRLKGGFDNNLLYIPYFIYIGAILLSQQIYHRSAIADKKLKSYFSEGFKTFIVIILLSVVFMRCLIHENPQFADESAQAIRNNLAAKGDKTPAEIDIAVELNRKNYPNIMTSFIIFGYLTIGALTALAGGLFFRRRLSVREQTFDQ